MVRIFFVAGLLPGIDFRLQKFSTGNAPIQALAAEDADLDLRHAQPARVLWGVVELDAMQEPSRALRRQCRTGAGVLNALHRTPP